MSRRLAAVSTPSIEVLSTSIDGCSVLKFKPFFDSRGSFCEIYNEKLFADIGLPTYWPQDNVSYSEEKVLRGLHIQKNNPQGKLMRCIQGVIFDVCVDLRPDSPTYLESISWLLSENSVMYLPPGTAHGFCVLSKDAIVHYKCTSLWDKESDGGILWSDPDLGIEWPLEKPIVSAKDAALPNLNDYLNSL